MHFKYLKALNWVNVVILSYRGSEAKITEEKTC